MADPAAAAAWWQPGSLLIAATPLGNPGDASARLTAALSAADLILAEDTRRLRRLMRDLGLAPPDRVLSCFDGNERSRCEPVLAALRLGERVVLVSDAGTPLVSDPGTAVIAAVLAEGLPIHALPGPSAVLIALVLSGCPTDRFTFEGFLPRTPAARDRRLARISAAEETHIVFESPRRVAATLTALVAACGADRPAALVREATKRHEEVRRGTLGSLAEHARTVPILGECVLVVGRRTMDRPQPAGGAAGDATSGQPAPDPDLMRAAASVATLVAAGADRRTAAREVATLTGQARSAVYNASLRDGPGSGPPG
ncbi:MAG: rRNA small subunit methyltransferase 1 [Actinomycetales bacterium]|nr:rRNA small subunit methyltransferase 1 [Actinomycetales bacterium]